LVVSGARVKLALVRGRALVVELNHGRRARRTGTAPGFMEMAESVLRLVNRYLAIRRACGTLER
jgi:hypothetical protein